jgi:mRNA interferase MazF
MTPKPGEVYLVDMGMAGKVWPVVIVTREDANAPRALSVTVPLTSQNRGTQYEVQMPRVPWLKHQSFANVQAIAAYEHHELLERRGREVPQLRARVGFGRARERRCRGCPRRRHWGAAGPRARSHAPGLFRRLRIVGGDRAKERKRQE